MFPSQRNTEQALERNIETLIRAWADLQDKQRQLDEFSEKNHRPEPPPKFETVAALVEYKQQKERYEERLGGYGERLENSRQTFELEAREIMPYFPEGVPLIFTSRRYGTSNVNNTYEIVKVTSDEHSGIQVRQLEGGS